MIIEMKLNEVYQQITREYKMADLQRCQGDVLRQAELKRLYGYVVALLLLTTQYAGYRKQLPVLHHVCHNHSNDSQHSFGPFILYEQHTVIVKCGFDSYPGFYSVDNIYN